jgi:MtN3 and saliva related transmembrane protein
MSPVTVLGLFAAALTTLSFLPQVIKTWKAKSADDLSLSTFSMFCAGVVCWLIYGLLVEDIPVIVANAVTLVLAGTVLVLALIYRRRANQPAD